MNPVSLTMHLAMLTFGLAIWLLGVPWNAGVVVVCMMTVAALGALATGSLRNHDDKHRAATGHASVDDTGFLGTQMRARLLLLERRQPSPVHAMSRTDRVQLGVAASGIAVAAALIVLMSWLPFAV